jgi:hypothetical protein
MSRLWSRFRPVFYFVIALLMITGGLTATTTPAHASRHSSSSGNNGSGSPNPSNSNGNSGSSGSEPSGSGSTPPLSGPPVVNLLALVVVNLIL